jgi:DNA helicase-4
MSEEVDVRCPREKSSSEFDSDLRELRHRYKRKRLRNLFRYVLIGFLIGGDENERIVDLQRKIKAKITEEASEIERMIKGIAESGTYLVYPSKSDLSSKIAASEANIESSVKIKALENEFASEITAKMDQYRMFVQDYNAEFINQRKREYKHLWLKGSISLDDEQQTAIVTDDKYNLVVAAAGSGKTEALITRIAYLIQRKPDHVQPKRILAIAYQRKAREQIEQRLHDRYGIEDVCVRTFHKLGKDILEDSGKKISRTDIVDENKKYGFIKSFVEEEIANNSTFRQLFIRYIVNVRDKDDEPTEADKNAVLNYAKQRSYISIDGTKVNSKAEKEIMDCLLTFRINGQPIAVRYEPDIGGFRPDFFLPHYDIFIEHWGLNKDGEVPEWFDQSTEEYRNSMEMKRSWFAEHNRMLVETYAYEYDPCAPEKFSELLKERILTALETRFPEGRFELTPVTYEELLEIVWDSQKTPIDDIQNFITTAKTYGLTPDDIEEKLKNGKWNSKQLAFGRLAHYVFRAYQMQLEKLGKTDFEDMINEATMALDHNNKLYENFYDHILIDEYQDISAQRLKLVKKLLERNPNCRLFCVGDDWQSIMGFSGSNLDFFVNFGDHFPNPAISKICTNYRSIKSIVDSGADLIRNNGNCQVQKPALSHRKETKPILVLTSLRQEGEVYCYQTVRDCLRRIEEYREKGYAADDILVLTRYMRTKIKGKVKYFRIVQTFSNSARNHGIKVAVDNAKESNAIKLLTVHKCKGLEAKVVFILDVVKGEFGFPSEIEDPAILEIAREDNGVKDQKEEERRLFYVGITRAKEDLYIYTQQDSKSEFLAEIAGYTKPVPLN